MFLHPGDYIALLLSADRKTITIQKVPTPKFVKDAFLIAAAAEALPDNYGVKIGTAEQVFAERCHRKVCKTGAKRKPYITLPEAWTNRMGIDYKNKANGHDDMTLEFSPDGTTITMRKTPAPKGMQANVDAEIFAVDSDANAELEELKNAEK